MVGIEAPSIRLKALRLPPSSRIATFSLTPSSLAFATAASTIFCASSEEMLCFFTTLAIGLTPHLICIAYALRVDPVLVVTNRLSCGRERSRGGFAAVDPDDLAGDEGRFVRSEEHDSVGDLFRLRTAFKRYGSIERRFFVGGPGQTIEHRGLGRTRGDCIDPDARRSGFESGGFRETFHRVLACGVEREIRRTALAHGRRNIDDAA